MTRVLHVISGIAPELGGPTAALLGMTKAQVRGGLQVALLATWRVPSGLANADAFRANGVDVTPIGPARDPMSRHPAVAPTLARLVAEADVVHVHGVWEQVQASACAAARAAGRPYVVTPHGMLAEWNMSRGRLHKFAYLALRMRRHLDAAAAIHYTTDAERRSTAPLGLEAPPLVETLGVDLDEFDPLPPPGRFRAKYPQLAGRPIVLFLGRLDYKKGLDLLVPAFARGAPPDAALVLAGPDLDGYGREVRAMVARAGIADRVLFTGMLHGRDRIEALADADLFALTSYVENFGVAVVEAMAAGVPVLISAEVNVAEMLADADVGPVVPTGVEPIAEALRTWLADPARRRAAGARAAGVARDRFAWSAVVARWVGHYRRLQPGNR